MLLLNHWSPYRGSKKKSVEEEPIGEEGAMILSVHGAEVIQYSRSSMRGGFLHITTVSLIITDGS